VSVERDQRRFFLCHATPSDPLFAYCPPESPAWADESAAVDADIILVGHSISRSSGDSAHGPW
jgi:hypothetical protein